MEPFKEQWQKDLFLWWPSCAKAPSGQSSSNKRSQHIPHWKGPTVVMESNPWLHTGLPKPNIWEWSPWTPAAQGCVHCPAQLLHAHYPLGQSLSLISDLFRKELGVISMLGSWDRALFGLGPVSHWPLYHPVSTKAFLLIESLSPLPIITCLRKREEGTWKWGLQTCARWK